MSRYSDLVIADTPESYWRLTETPVSSGSTRDDSTNNRHPAVVQSTGMTKASSLLTSDSDPADQTAGAAYLKATGYQPLVNGRGFTFETWGNLSVNNFGCLWGDTNGRTALQLTGLGIWLYTSVGIDAAVKLANFGAISTGSVTHVVMVFDEPNNVARLYVNAVSQLT